MLFIDDREPNLRAAELIGMTTPDLAGRGAGARKAGRPGDASTPPKSPEARRHCGALPQSAAPSSSGEGDGRHETHQGVARPGEGALGLGGLREEGRVGHAGSDVGVDEPHRALVVQDEVDPGEMTQPEDPVHLDTTA